MPGVGRRNVLTRQRHLYLGSGQETLVQGIATTPTARFVPWFTMVQSARIDSTKLHSGKEEET